MMKAMQGMGGAGGMPDLSSMGLGGDAPDMSSLVCQLNRAELG